MSEKNIIVPDTKIKYSGLFNVLELYSMIDTYFKEKNYDKVEKRNEERIYPKGKEIELVLQPYRNVTDYYKYVIKLEILMKNVTEVEIEKDKKKIRMNHGDITIVYSAWIQTDFENRSEVNPLYVFYRTLMDKYIFRNYFDKHSGNLKNDVKMLQTNIKAFLNLYKY